MTSPDLPPHDLDALEQTLFEQDLLPAPPDLAAYIVAGLPRGRRVLSLQAVARLAAAVLLAIGTWVATLGGLPTLAHAEPPPLVGEILAPTREILPRAELDLESLGLEGRVLAAEEVPAAALAGIGAVLLGAGLLLARRASKEKTS